MRFRHPEQETPAVVAIDPDEASGSRLPILIDMPRALRRPRSGKQDSLFPWDRRYGLLSK
jgi:hypothetical protein